MARLPETKQLAQQIRRHATGAVKSQGLRIFSAIVREANPLVVELPLDDVLLEESDLLLGTWPRMFDRQWGIAVNDQLILIPLESGEWYVSDVISANALDGGLDWTKEVALSRNWQAEAVGGAGTVTFGSVVGKVPFFDKSGAQVGVTLLFDPGTL